MSNVTASEPLPRYIVIELTKRCNNRCLYCYAVQGNDAQKYNGSRLEEMTTDEIKEVVIKLQKELPIETIGLSGGEPFLRKDLPEIVSFISGKGIDPIIITNGTLISQNVIEATVQSAHVYQVTLLSYKKEIHDHLVGRAGAWEAAINGMINVTRAGGDLVVVFVATRLNCHDLYKTAELAIVLGAKVLMYNRINLSAHNMHFVEELLPDAQMIQENLESLEKIGEKYGISSAASVVIEPCIVPMREYKHVQVGWCPLGGEESYFTIDPLGNIRICNHSPVILGNIKHDSIKEIFLNHPYVCSFRTTFPDECSSCNPELKKICRGGCKAASEQCYGTIKKVDPFVNLVKQNAVHPILPG